LSTVASLAPSRLQPIPEYHNCDDVLMPSYVATAYA
jgi:hypothetical protein